MAFAFFKLVYVAGKPKGIQVKITVCIYDSSALRQPKIVQN